MTPHQIFKYRADGMFAEVDIPANARILHWGIQEGAMHFWAEVDPSQPEVKRTFIVYGTGASVDPSRHIYQHTYFEGRYVWHIYEVLEET